MAEYIKREAALNILRKLDCLCASVIERMPYIEAEPVRRGKWEYRAVDTPNLGRRYEMYCTACGKTPDPKKGFDYCPMCGAKMDKENDNGKL